LLAVVQKGMDHSTKVALISRLNLVGVCRELQKLSAQGFVPGGAGLGLGSPLKGGVGGGGGGGGDEDDDEEEAEESAARAAQLAAGVGQELLACLRAAAAAAAADESQPHAASPPAAACAAAATLLDELMPVGVAHLRSLHEPAVIAVLPLCTAYGWVGRSPRVLPLFIPLSTT